MTRTPLSENPKLCTRPSASSWGVMYTKRTNHKSGFQDMTDYIVFRYICNLTFHKITIKAKMLFLNLFRGLNFLLEELFKVIL